ncbi:MAG: ABC-2 family transporter protein [Leptospiraceae bacterium]|nr:ABC-2 family transporter protein [Leptospiraceae bacterium]MCK6380723.1 ABC-2 family transporter protein [Leptospiraceae bacterium]
MFFLQSAHSYLQLALASVKSRMEYRASFFIFLFTLVSFYTAQALTIGIIIHRFKVIGGWSVGEIAFLYSLLILSQGIVSCLFSGVVEFGNFIREGTFDRLLVRPLSPLGQVIASGFELVGLAHLILGLITFFIANSLIRISWSFFDVVIFITVILGGSMILAGIRIIIAAIAFYAVNNNSLVHLFVFSSREFLLYPLNIYSKGVKFLLTFIIPLGFVNFYPAQYFLKKSGEGIFHEYIVYFTLPIGVLLFLISILFWRKGQKDYESAGG